MYRFDISLTPEWRVVLAMSSTVDRARPERPGVTLSPVSFRPDAVRGWSDGLPGQVDYRLARQHLINEYRRGRLSRVDVCDAHPELVRNAVNLGEASFRPCPICEADELVLVTYVFGPRLPAHGRCISSKQELAKLARAPRELAAYVVEVCRACSWNHLARAFTLGGRGARAV